MNIINEFSSCSNELVGRSVSLTLKQRCVVPWSMHDNSTNAIHMMHKAVTKMRSHDSLHFGFISELCVRDVAIRCSLRCASLTRKHCGKLDYSTLVYCQKALIMKIFVYGCVELLHGCVHVAGSVGELSTCVIMPGKTR